MFLVTPLGSEKLFKTKKWSKADRRAVLVVVVLDLFFIEGEFVWFI